MSLIAKAHRAHAGYLMVVAVLVVTVTLATVAVPAQAGDWQGKVKKVDGVEYVRAAIKAGLSRAKVDPDDPRRPSVETVLHAIALQLEGVRFVGHTHPTAVNAVLCSQKVEEVIAGRLFPDEIVYCGPAPVYIPYTDPGVPLARTFRAAIGRYLDEYRENPKVILMQNHGLIALGKTASEVENITAMYEQAAGLDSAGAPYI